MRATSLNSIISLIQFLFRNLSKFLNYFSAREAQPPTQLRTVHQRAQSARIRKGTTEASFTTAAQGRFAPGGHDGPTQTGKHNILLFLHVKHDLITVLLCEF